MDILPTIIINIERMLTDLLNQPFGNDLDLMIYDKTAGAESGMLYQPDSNLNSSVSDFQLEISMLNRIWMININKQASFYERTVSRQTLYIRVAGMIIASIICIGIVIITGQRLFLEELVRHRTYALESANKTKSNFMANMSHELRTPLNAIIGFSGIMNQRMFGAIGSKKYEEYIEDIHDSSPHLLNLVNDILDLSALEAGKVTLNKENLDLKPLVDHCIRGLEPLWKAKSIEITVDIKPAALKIFADSMALKQIIINLVSNAIKFTPAGVQSILGQINPVRL